MEFFNKIGISTTNIPIYGDLNHEEYLNVLNGFKNGNTNIINKYRCNEDLFKKVLENKNYEIIHLFSEQFFTKKINNIEIDNPEKYLSLESIKSNKNNSILTIKDIIIDKCRNDFELVKEFGQNNNFIYALCADEKIKKDIYIPEKYVKIIKYCNKDTKKILLSSNESINYTNLFENFIEKNGIENNIFLQYFWGIDTDWLSKIINIINNKKDDDFAKFYKMINNNKSIYSSIDIFYLLLINFDKYNNLINNLLVNDNISDDQIDDVIYVFKNDSLSNINSLDDMDKRLKDVIIKKLQTSDTDITTLKNKITSILFNKSYDEINGYIKVYGSVEDLVQLEFDNRNNSDLCKDIENMIVLTSMMEDIIYCNDVNSLKLMLDRIKDNIDLTIACSKIFDKYSENMRILYEEDIISNLSNSQIFNDKPVDIVDGINIYDYSDKEYYLLIHGVKNISKKNSEENRNNTIDDIANGRSSGDKNYMCFSAVSHRNYSILKHRGLVFGFTNIPENNFISSSLTDMGSNNIIKPYDYQQGVVDINRRKQRGISEVSQTMKHIRSDGLVLQNSEILCYRDGIKPSCVVVTSKEEITDEVKDVAKKYNFSIVIVQNNIKDKNGKENRIDNPIPISENKRFDSKNNNETYEKLKILRDNLLRIKNSKKEKRKIAIYADSHGLFEPTLAILEDARKNGINEIYSLGDNIGTGANPSEVLWLLNRYNVFSLKGNHEHYVLDGVDKYKKHLDDCGPTTYQKALHNSNWTRDMLSESEIEYISQMPEELEIELGGKKILLKHFIKDYNSNEENVNLDEYFQVFQGHSHFKSEKYNLKTLRGAGIGGTSGTASYIILTETDDGYEIEEKEIPYNYSNLLNDINLSSLNEHDKKKITKWIGENNDQKNKQR